MAGTGARPPWRVPGFGRRAEAMPEPELVEQYPAAAYAQHDLAPGDDRIRAKIADVIKSRVRPVAPMAPAQHAPLTRGRGRGPDPLVFNPARSPIKAEPPLTAAHKTAAAAATAAVMPMTAPVAAQPRYADAWAAQDENIFDDSYDAYDAYDPAPDQSYRDMPAAPRYDAGQDDDDIYAYEADQDHAPEAQPMQIPVAQPRYVVQHAPRKPVQPSTRARFCPTPP